MQVWERIRDNKRWIIIAAAVVVFIAVLQDVRSDDILRLDATAFSFFVIKLRTPWITGIMEGFSSLSSPIVIGVMFLMVIAFAPGRRPGLCAFVNLVSVVLINQVLKYIVQRPRPDGFRLISETGYSFPSGHSMVSMAFYGLCAWMVWNYERDRIMRWACCIAFSLIIVVVGMSRVYLGVHYASDVIAGFCVSLAWIGVYTQVFCPLFMPEERDQHAETIASPAYVPPERPNALDDTGTMKARHLNWEKMHLPREDDPS
ncbi:MAG: phosphatase PAP2 family protein [Coriobacteriales bacterium]|nr:phosphatase PAP2 family protein [Coriobacteriales bacterium]